MPVDIIIVNWNSGHLLSACVESVLHSQPSDLGFRIVIVDNASVDDSLQSLPDDSRVTLIRNKANLGFGAACNIGIRNSSSEFILLLNPDTLLPPNLLKDALDFMKSRSEISVMGVQLHDRKGNIARSCSRFPVARRYIWEILGLSKVFPQVFTPPAIMRDWDHTASRFVDHVIGACTLIRQSMLQQTGLFDEDFFMYLEDLDLSNRAHQLGHKIFYNSEISAFHEGGGVSRQVKSQRLFYSLRSRLRYCRKYFSTTDYLALLILTLLAEPVTRTLPQLLTFRFKDAAHTIAAYTYLYRDLLKTDRH